MQLIVENLSIERGGRRLAEGLSFVLKPGDVLLLLGPNGSGKTTLLRTLVGFARPASGAITLEGAAPDHEIAEKAHYIGHLNAVKPALTVAENLTFWAAYLGGSGASLGAALQRFELDGLADIPAGYLSAGQKRRLGLARLIVVARPLWLLDEPTVSLDTQGVEALAKLIGEHRAGGGMVVAATHIPLGLSGARELTLGARAAAP